MAMTARRQKMQGPGDVGMAEQRDRGLVQTGH